MSQPPSLPQDVLTADTIPVAYAMPDASDVRPGLVTSIGVCSIIVAVLQAGTAIMVCFMAFGLYILSIVPPPQPYVPTVANTNYPDGLPIDRAAMLTDRMTEIASLTPARRLSLDALLRQSGRDVAPNMLNGDITAEKVKRLIVTHAKTSDGHDLILVPEGRIELSDTEATFEPEGSTQVVTVDTAKMGLNVIVPLASPTPVNATPKVNVNPLRFVTWFVTSIASGLLCILLLIAGILALRGSKGGRRAHLWWAWLKLPVALLGAIGGGLMIETLTDVGSQNNPQTSAAAGAVTGVVVGVVQAALSVGYIIAVIVVMNARSVRAWFATR